jgi:hypothetical protein
MTSASEKYGDPSLPSSDSTSLADTIRTDNSVRPCSVPAVLSSSIPASKAPSVVHRDDDFEVAPSPNKDSHIADNGPVESPPPEAGRTSLETALIVISLSAALFLAALDTTIVTVAIPTIAQEFNSTTGYTWIGSAYMLASAAMAPMWGKISDIWGRKPIMLIAVAVFWVGSLLCALSKNMPMLIAVRALQGVGGGGIIILVNICISDLFSMRRRGKHRAWIGVSL